MVTAAETYEGENTILWLQVAKLVLIGNAVIKTQQVFYLFFPLKYQCLKVPHKNTNG